MIKGYRPEGWSHNRSEFLEHNQPLKPRHKTRQSDYEAGADTMLKALRETGQHGKDTDFRNPALDKENMGKLGTLVFIPDDTKN